MARPSSLAKGVMVAAAAVFVGAGVYVLQRGKSPEPPASPSSAPKPSLEALDGAIERGTHAFIDEYVKPSWDAVSNGGYRDYTDAVGETRRYGPRAYVACELYLLTHYLMYFREFGVSPQDPLLAKVKNWFIQEFDPAEGRWIWSEEGCLHAKGMIALGRHGRSDLVDKAWAWARRSPLWRDEHHMFTMMQSGAIIQTLGRATLSMSGQRDWEHGSPLPDAENSAKFFFAMLESGHSATDSQIAELNDGINHYLETNPLTFDEMDTRDVIGMIWYVYCHHRFGLPKRGGYDFAVRTMEAGIRGGAQMHKNALSEHFSAVRGKVIKALLMAGKYLPEMNAEIGQMLARQAPSGAWPLTPAARKAWGLDAKPVIGIKIGQMDGANTYLVTLALIAYRDAIYPGADRESPPVSSDRPTVTRPVAVSESATP